MIVSKSLVNKLSTVFVDNINPKDKVLDIGCGNEALTFEVV